MKPYLLLLLICVSQTCFSQKEHSAFPEIGSQCSSAGYICSSLNPQVVTDFNQMGLAKDEDRKGINESSTFFEGLAGLFMHSYDLPNYFVYDEVTGSGGWVYQRFTDPIVGIGIRGGQKIYFGSMVNSFRAGIQPTARIDIGFTNKLKAIRWNIINIGFASIYQLSESRAIEFNFDMGPSILFDRFVTGYQYLNASTELSLSISPNIKFRMNNLAIGIDYSRNFLNDVQGSTADIFSISIGGTF